MTSREAIDRLRRHLGGNDVGEIVVFWILATLEVITTVSAFLLPPLGVVALVKFIFS
jgi:hypothetical protein